MYSRTPLIRIKWDGNTSGYAENPDKGVFFENRLHWQFEVGKKSINGYFRLHIYLRTNKTLIHNSLNGFDIWGGGGVSHKKMYNYRKKMFTRRAKPIRIASVRRSGVLLYKPNYAA